MFYLQNIIVQKYFRKLFGQLITSRRSVYYERILLILRILLVHLTCVNNCVV